MSDYVSELGGLANPVYHQEKLTLREHSQEELLAMLRMMLTVRGAEEFIAEMIKEGTVKCPCHLGIGQEAIAVGIAAVLQKTDRVFGTHRAHAHYLALGGSVYELFAEVLGRVTGCSKGMGGSMHLQAKQFGFYGSVPIVGGTVPLAAGAALAAQLDEGDDIAVCFFGDGTAEEGVVHESLNLAAVKNLPLLFVCENNLYSSHLDIKLRQPCDRIARYAEAHHIPAKTVDGNDVFAVEEAASELVDDIRAGKGSGFLEVVTYRWRGHVGPKEDVDVGVRRSESDLQAWKKRDPIRRLTDAMFEADCLTNSSYQKERDKINNYLQKEASRAKEAPYPEEEALLNHVYTT